MQIVKKWIVICIDYGDSCDGKPRLLQVLNSKEEAYEWAKKDIQEMIDNSTSDNGDCPYVCDFDKLSVRCKNEEDNGGCEWNIQKITIEV